MSALSPLHTIGTQLIETLQLHLSIDKPAAHRLSLDWLKRVGIPDPEERIRAYPYQLSGGMLQRVMIAMALMLEPALIIADEPTTALDVTIQAQILDLLREMKNRDTSLLIITHDLGIVWEMCDRVLVMYAAKIVESGGRHDLFTRPAHPYTQALLESVISLTSHSDRLSSIEGHVPSPLAYPAGCRFADRCKFAFARCRQACPALYPVTATHHSACFRSEVSDPGPQT
jgi:peptide/nickel transport system ATP-binding protein/oligopeptide transport system ATP-binding protein